MYGANEAAVLEDQQLPRYIRITDVKDDGTLHEDTFRSLEEEVAGPYLLQDGDILLARSGATVGKSFQYLESWGKAAYAGYLIRGRVDKRITFPRFSNYYFQTECYWACIRSTLIQATIENFEVGLLFPTIEQDVSLRDVN
jgi:type I restriction enzyme S subunit